MTGQTAPSPNITALLELRGLTKHFSIGRNQVVHACEDVNLILHRSETLGLIGESGSGKTTLGRCILRLVEHTAGQVIFEGVDIGTLSKRDLRHLRADMQIVFQEPMDSFDPLMTIGRQITEPLRIHRGMGARERRHHAAELLQMVGLPAGVADALPATLSAGALQRSSIARAIATRPKLVILDEPTSALAPEAEIEIIALLKRLQAELNLTYVFISHDLPLIGSVCDRVAVMYLSQIVELGTREAIFAAPQHPYTQALLAASLVPDPRQRRLTRSAPLTGEIPSSIDLPTGCYFASRCKHVRQRCLDTPQRLKLGVGGDRWTRCWRIAEGDLRSVEYLDS